MPKKKFAILCLGVGKGAEVAVKVHASTKKKPKTIQYREKDYNLDTLTMNAEMVLPRISILAAKGLGMPDHLIGMYLTGTCVHGKDFLTCHVCSRRKQCKHGISVGGLFHCEECGF